MTTRTLGARKVPIEHVQIPIRASLVETISCEAYGETKGYRIEIPAKKKQR